MINYIIIHLLRCSPLYSMLDQAGASWGAKMGWERPNWFMRSSDGNTSHYTICCVITDLQSAENL